MDISDLPSPDELRAARRRKEKCFDMTPSASPGGHADIFSIDGNALIAERQKNTTTLLSRGTRSAFFITQDSGRYLTHADRVRMEYNIHRVSAAQKFDAVHVRHEKHIARSEVFLKNLSVHYDRTLRHAARRKNALARVLADIELPTLPEISPPHIVLSKVSLPQVPTLSHIRLPRIDASVLFRRPQVQLASVAMMGVVSFALVYSALSGNSGNDSRTTTQIASAQLAINIEHTKNGAGIVLGAADNAVLAVRNNTDTATTVVQEKPKELAQVPVVAVQKKAPAELKLVDSAQKNIVKDSIVTDFEREAYEMVKGHPIEKMLPYILEQDEKTAAYLIAIAKKESNWGKRVPVLNGQDCFNYWGYRGQRKLMGSGGHTCFNSRQDAVDTVGKRIKTLVYEYERETPSRMVVWKCGSSCAGHGSSAQKWIDDVALYYNRLQKFRS